MYPRADYCPRGFIRFLSRRSLEDSAGFVPRESRRGQFIYLYFIRTLPLRVVPFYTRLVKKKKNLNNTREKKNKNTRVVGTRRVIFDAASGTVLQKIVYKEI